MQWYHIQKMSTPLWLFSKGRVSQLFITLHVNCKVSNLIATGQMAGLSDSPEAPGDRQVQV